MRICPARNFWMESDVRGGDGVRGGSGVASGKAVGFCNGCIAGLATRPKIHTQPNVTSAANNVAFRSESISRPKLSLKLIGPKASSLDEATVVATKRLTSRIPSARVRRSKDETRGARRCARASDTPEG